MFWQPQNHVGHVCLVNPTQNLQKPTIFASKTEQRVVAWAGRHLHVMLLARNVSREFLGVTEATKRNQRGRHVWILWYQ